MHESSAMLQQGSLKLMRVKMQLVANNKLLLITDTPVEPPLITESTAESESLLGRMILLRCLHFVFPYSWQRLFDRTVYYALHLLDVAYFHESLPTKLIYTFTKNYQVLQNK